MMDSTTIPTPPPPELADEGQDEDEIDDEIDEESIFDQPHLQHNNDSDSSLGDDGGSIMNYGSIAESIYNFRVENGRTYHAYAEGKYYVPNDELDQYRGHLNYHAVCRMFDGKAFFSPVESPQRIVDIGTGTGDWAVDVADHYPSAQVTGTDLSPIQPSWVPPNVEFRIDDLDKPWGFEQPIDLVHSRICSGIAIRDWPKYLSECYRCLRPGGWVEAQEFYNQLMCDDDSFPSDSAIIQWDEAANRGMLLGGCDMRVSSQQIKSYMEAGGFVNVQTIDMKLPMSPWSKDPKLREAGLYMMAGLLGDLHGISLKVFTQLLGWKIKDLEVLLRNVEKEWRREDIHGYWPLFVVYGQKPLES